MTLFLLACAGLVLLSSVFYLFPRVRSGAAEADLDRANLEWFRQREAELAGDENSALQEDARIRLLEDQSPYEEQQRPPAQSFPVWLLLPSVALLAGALYYVLGAAPDVLITQRLQTMQENTAPAQMRALIHDVEARSAQRPDNLHYLALLGRYYMGEEDYQQATQTYDALVAVVPEDAQALAYAAQAEYLAAGRTLGDRARLRAEQALAADPRQRTALGLLGMASFEQQQYRAAVEYWQRLQAMEPADSESGQMIAQVIETARQRLAQQDPGAEPVAATGTTAAPIASTADPATAEATTTTTTAATAGTGVTVRVTAPPDAAIAATDTVFILARNAESDSRMPIAVQRLTGAQLPVTLRLDDSNSMAGQKLSQTASVIVAVQVSADGRPGAANASWMAEVGPVAPSNDDTALEIVLHPNSK
ncbi:MAG: c-type cytochrome biogenesis protein CcmI [Haliea sp.]|nr:c-type cytochrome biogenesis protein CcmI [Haliea sp.]